MDKNKTLELLHSLGIDKDSKKLELKLKAISKHTYALAKELERIDNTVQCDKCGCLNVCTSRVNGKLVYASCNDCEHDLGVNES